MPRGVPNHKRPAADNSHGDMPIRQRVVNAAGAPLPQTSAPASVFAFGQAAKHYGVDVAAVRAELAEPVQASAPAAPPATRAAKKTAAAAPRAKAPPVKYRCADTGATWSGRGLQPAWVKAALANGRTLADLQAAPAAAKTPIAALREAVAAEEVEA